MNRLGLLLFFLPSLLFAQLPEDFADIVYADGYSFPTAIEFDNNGQLYIATKGGKVFVIDSSGAKVDQPLVNVGEEVTWWGDHGLMSMTLDPDFLENGYFYLLYSVDLHHLLFYDTPQYSKDSIILSRPSIGRVTRYQADRSTQFTTLVPGSRKILLGEEINNGIPLYYTFHGIGDIKAAIDGTLLISAGDGTGNKIADTGGDEGDAMASEAIGLGIITEDMDLGSYKAQYPGAYSGKILRIDSETGDGAPSNPYYDPEHPRAPQSRVWAMGFRNPYRIALHPETGSHYPNEGDPGTLFVGDVGNGSWEELNIVTQAGQNFGWPLVEGVSPNWSFLAIDAPKNQLAPNPLAAQGPCNLDFFTFKDVFVRKNEKNKQAPSNPCNNLESIPEELLTYETLPVLAWSNSRWNPPNRAVVAGVNPESGNPSPLEVTDASSPVKSEAFAGYASLGGVFYTDGNYPEAYHNSYFGVDFSGWIKQFQFDDALNLQTVIPFHDAATDVIHMTQHPKSGDLFFINLKGEIRTIEYGGNPPPVAIIETDQSFGRGPLTVQFDASQSFDKDQSIHSYFWDFGDGTTSDVQNPQHTFKTTGSQIRSYTVALTVTDSLGAASIVEEIISLNNTPPQVEITSFQDGDLYPIDATALLALEAEVVDLEHQAEELNYEWRIFLHHNDHYHPEPAIYDPASYALVSPLGCQEELYWYRVTLKVSDPEGLQTQLSQNIYPYCGPEFVEATDLEASPSDQTVALTWSTKEEFELSSYLVQRSPDLFNFSTIGSLAPQGSGSDYQFIDQAPLQGKAIYRVKRVNQDRAFDYSNLATVNFPAEVVYDRPQMQISPNPASEQVEIYINQANAERVDLQLFDLTGRKLLQTNWQAILKQTFRKSIRVSQLDNGVYFYILKNGEQEEIGQLLITR